MALTAVYTWAKSLDDKSAAAGVGAQNFNGWQGYLDNHDPNRDYGPSDFNVGQRFVSSFVYDLPVGKGKKFGGNLNKAADLLIGGWEVTGSVFSNKAFRCQLLVPTRPDYLTRLAKTEPTRWEAVVVLTRG